MRKIALKNKRVVARVIAELVSLGLVHVLKHGIIKLNVQRGRGSA